MLNRRVRRRPSTPHIFYIGSGRQVSCSSTTCARNLHVNNGPLPRIGGCLCRPGTSVVGTNYFSLIRRQFNIARINPDDRLFISTAPITSFPNEKFTVRTVNNVGGGSVGQLLGNAGRTGVTMHGFPLATPRLHGGLGLTSNNPICLFNAAVRNYSRILLHASGV